VKTKHVICDDGCKLHSDRLIKLKYIPPHVKAAVLIRKELKSAFPTIKFRVISSSFSMGDSVDIFWDNGPSRDAVRKITRKYQYGHFDSMTDCYENSNCREDLPQSKFVTCQRTITPELLAQAANQIKKIFVNLDEER
jgi:hypothetical protein